MSENPICNTLSYSNTVSLVQNAKSNQNPVFRHDKI